MGQKICLSKNSQTHQKHTKITKNHSKITSKTNISTKNHSIFFKNEQNISNILLLTCFHFSLPVRLRNKRPNHRNRSRNNLLLRRNLQKRSCRNYSKRTRKRNHPFLRSF